MVILHAMNNLHAMVNLHAMNKLNAMVNLLLLFCVGVKIESKDWEKGEKGVKEKKKEGIAR